jgi:hypothetical protein
MSSRPRNKSSLKHGLRGCVTWRTAAPIARGHRFRRHVRGPRACSDSRRMGPRRAFCPSSSAQAARCSEAYAQTALSGPPWTSRSAWLSPARWSQESHKRVSGGTGCLRIPLYTVSPFILAEQGGRPDVDRHQAQVCHVGRSVVARRSRTICVRSAGTLPPAYRHRSPRRSRRSGERPRHIPDIAAPCRERACRHAARPPCARRRSARTSPGRLSCPHRTPPRAVRRTRSRPKRRPAPGVPGSSVIG